MLEVFLSLFLQKDNAKDYLHLQDPYSLLLNFRGKLIINMTINCFADSIPFVHMLSSFLNLFLLILTNSQLYLPATQSIFWNFKAHFINFLFRFTA
jgi:hypothetical protein